MDTSPNNAEFAICISSRGYDDLQQRKIYQLLSDDSAASHDYVRVIDDSGEDYLYPASRFVLFQFPDKIAEQLVIAEPSVA